MLENHSNGTLEARALEMRFWNEINSGLQFLLHRSCFWSEDRQTNVFGFGFCGVRDRREKAFGGRFLEATTSALICLYLIFTDSTKSTLNKTLLFSRPVG